MKTMLLDLNSYTLKNKAIVFDPNNINDSFNISFNPNEYAHIGAVIKSESINRVILQGAAVISEKYMKSVSEELIKNNYLNEVEFIYDTTC